MKKMLMVLAALGAASVFPAQADAVCTENCVKRMVTEYKGRPPFKRSFEMVSVAEAQEKKASSQRVFKPGGKPPYKNRNQAGAQRSG